MFPEHTTAKLKTKLTSKNTCTCMLVYYRSFIFLSLHLTLKKNIPGVREKKQAEATMSSLSEHLKSHAEELADFWATFDLAEHQDVINKYLGTRSIDDLQFVTLPDMQTLQFHTWAGAYLTVVAKNRLVAAVASVCASADDVPASPPQTQI